MKKTLAIRVMYDFTKISFDLNSSTLDCKKLAMPIEKCAKIEAKVRHPTVQRMDCTKIKFIKMLIFFMKF